MRKALGVLSAAALVLSLLHPARALADAPPVPDAKAWVLMDGNTGQVLYQHDMDGRHLPASTTKILTALVGVEHGKLDDVYTIDPSATQLPRDSTLCGLVPGEQQSLRSLLMGLMLPSGNDCALAIAQGETGGNINTFVDWMNQKAQALGLHNSHFTNPHGLDDNNHYTTANDLAQIARAAFANDTVRRIAGTKQYQMPGPKHQQMINHVQLLFTYDGAFAGKTGFTDQAGATLVTAAKRDNQYLIGVIMGEKLLPHTYQDMVSLLDYGFGNFQAKQIVTQGQPYGPVTVTAGIANNVDVVAAANLQISEGRSKGDAGVLIQPEVPSQVTAPVHKGEKIGAVQVSVDGQVIGAVPLLAAADIAPKPTAISKAKTIGLMLLKWVFYVMVALVSLRMVGLIVRSLRRRRRQARMPRYNRGAHIQYYRTTSNRR